MNLIAFSSLEKHLRFFSYVTFFFFSPLIFSGEMSRILRGLKVLRNHWKKSTLAFSLLVYGSSRAVDKYKTLELMRAYCEEAKLFGDESAASTAKMRHVTVILNPEAHNGKATSLFEKYSAPLLHLAGVKVDVIETTKENHAKNIMEVIDNTDAIVIAGGNGTVHEVVTGLLRRQQTPGNGSFSVPLGIVPVGKTNTVAKYLFWTEDFSDARYLAEATMAVIKQKTTSIDVMKIKGEKGKPVFAVSNFEMGPFCDLEQNIGRYWYFGPLKAKAAYILNSWKDRPLIDDMNMEFVSPCSGCSKCYSVPVLKTDSTEPKRWWSAFIPKAQTPSDQMVIKDCSGIMNDDCGRWLPDEHPFSNIIISTGTGTVSKDQSDAFLITRCPPKMSNTQFISAGLKHHEGKIPSVEDSFTTFARELKMTPKESQGKWFYIDSESYEAQPVHISLLPRHLLVFVNKGSSNKVM